jgi:Acetyltransferase (GNAT) domain
MLRDLGDGLVMRRGRAADAEALATLSADCLRFQDMAEPHPAFGVVVRDLMTGRHPTFRPEDALLVEDAGGALVSGAVFVTQNVRFAGIALVAGQPEFISTLPAYRGRGLVRAMLDTFHAWSAERGHAMQLISGIPWFYRQFGYELAIERGGGPVVAADRMPADATGAYRVRPMTLDDAAFAASLDAHAAQRYLLTVPRDDALWRYELGGHSNGSIARSEWCLVETLDGRPLATSNHRPRLDGGTLAVMSLEVVAGVPWRAVVAALVPYWKSRGDELAARDGKKPLTSLGFWSLGREHPLYGAMHFTDFWRPEGLYTRVPDLARFLGDIRPVLQRRLAASPMNGYSGTLVISLYRHGVELVFEHGTLTRVAAWRPSLTTIGQEMSHASSDRRRPDALFPGLTFLQLLFGSRSFAELETAFPDCIVRTGEGRALLDALFPRQPSDVWPVI